MNLSSRTLRRAAAIAGAAAALVAIPSAAEAQSLQSVAISTSSSSNFFVLDVSGGSTQAGAKVIQWYGSGAANQRWNIVELPGGGEHIVNQKSGLCLAADNTPGDSLFQWYCNNDDANEKWSGHLEQVFGGGFTHGRTLPNAGSGLVADVANASGKAGAPVIGWYESDAYNQGFSYYQLY